MRASEDSSTDAYYRFLVTLLGTLTFAVEWEELSDGPGGPAHVAAAYQKIFYLVMEQPQVSDKALTKAAATLAQEKKEVYRKWRVINEPVVTGRNKLLGAYRVVCFPKPLYIPGPDAGSRLVWCWHIFRSILVSQQSQRQSSHTTLETCTCRGCERHQGEER